MDVGRRPLNEDNLIFFLMIRRPPRSTLDRSSAASDVYKRQRQPDLDNARTAMQSGIGLVARDRIGESVAPGLALSLIHISEPTRPY